MKSPTQIKYHQKSRYLEVCFEDTTFELSCEYLRVFSPSAEVQGHGSEPMTLVTGKKNIKILKIEPIGQYAVKLIFDDGHDTGLYSWDTFYNLGQNYQKNWESYLERLQKAGKSRGPEQR